jgi:molybdopterin synthase catalytic subunit
LDVRILYFATLRQRAGGREERITLAEGATVADLKLRLGDLHESLRPALDSALVAVNREFALPEQTIADGDEIAVFPPVSGGAGPTIFRVTEEALDLNTLLASLLLPSSGAACVFTGVVRGRTAREGGRQTDHLEYEAYEPMAEAKMQQVADEIRQRWPQVEGVAIVQRVGRLAPGTPTVLIACTAAHRDTGVFEAARYGIDRLKEIVPVWKKEVGPSGETWVEGGYHPGAQDQSPRRTPRRPPRRPRAR